MRLDRPDSVDTAVPPNPSLLTPPYTLDRSLGLPLFDRSVSLLCWAYNEEEIIGDFLVRVNDLLKRTVADYEIVVVDDCSTDRTNDIVRSLQATISQITIVRNPVNLNVGLSSQKAIMSATKEYLFWQTVDWSYDISLLRVYLEFLRTYDVVAGVRGGAVGLPRVFRFFRPLLGVLRLLKIRTVMQRSDTIRKAMVSIINYLLIRFLFRVPLSDFQNVVFYPTRLIQSIAFESSSSFTNPEGLLKSHWKGWSIVEVPILFRRRVAGEAKGTRFKAVISSMKDIWRLWFKWIVLGQRGSPIKGHIRRWKPEEWGLK